MKKKEWLNVEGKMTDNQSSCHDKIGPADLKDWANRLENDYCVKSAKMYFFVAFIVWLALSSITVYIILTNGDVSQNRLILAVAGLIGGVVVVLYMGWLATVREKDRWNLVIKVLKEAEKLRDKGNAGSISGKVSMNLDGSFAGTAQMDLHEKRE